MGRTIAELGEDALIGLFARGGVASGPEVIVPNGDDAAAFRETGAVVVTTDALVEGVHFDLAYVPPRRVGRKLLAVNLSDVAAMGAAPRHALLALALPPTTAVEVVEALAEGIGEACVQAGVVILGGNLSRTSGPMVLTATLIGAAPPVGLVTRKGARPGDVLCVTGTLGDARAGLEIAAHLGRPLTAEDPGFALFERHVDPTARVAAGPVLAGRARAMCDVSDGLGRDVLRLLVGDVGLGAELDLERLPVSEALRRHAGPEAPMYALRGGEDYELLFAVAPAEAPTLIEALGAVHTPATLIGRVVAGEGLTVLEGGRAREVGAGGFDHFR